MFACEISCSVDATTLSQTRFSLQCSFIHCFHYSVRMKHDISSLLQHRLSFFLLFLFYRSCCETPATMYKTVNNSNWSLYRSLKININCKFCREWDSVDADIEIIYAIVNVDEGDSIPFSQFDEIYTKIAFWNVCSKRFFSLTIFYTWCNLFWIRRRTLIWILGFLAFEEEEEDNEKTFCHWENMGICLMKRTLM